jgi:glycosyltransferase involved in cell wall biosynthesis
MTAFCQSLPNIRVVQSVPGVFHHFDLARELYAQANLTRIYSTFPWSRLKREGLPRSIVGTFPLIGPALMLCARYGLSLPRPVLNQLDQAHAVTFDRWVAAHLPPCDAFVGLSSFGLLTGRTAQSRGGVYVCDRGSAHVRFQRNLLAEEFHRWGVPFEACASWSIAREELEYEQADAITVPSEFVRRSFVQMGVPAERVHKIPYGVNLQKFHPVGAPPAESFEVLFVGQVGFRKGVPYLLQAFERLSHPRKRLRIVGVVKDEIRPYLAKHLPRNVEIVGAVPQAELKAIMSTSHVMVLPSLEEGLALVQGQAMACGCPLIASTNTGGTELFTDGVEGFEAPIRSADAIAERLQQLADDPHLQRQMSHAALERVKQLGGWSTYGEQYTCLLRELIAKRS